jgi:hypothetical protein
VALVETLAYVGDHLSYTQDAVASEAYLGTARRRTSLRRHARLLDYALHDGCNARVFVTLEVTAKAEGKKLAVGRQLLAMAADGSPGTRAGTARPAAADYHRGVRDPARSGATRRAQRDRHS